MLNHQTVFRSMNPGLVCEGTENKVEKIEGYTHCLNFQVKNHHLDIIPLKTYTSSMLHYKSGTSLNFPFRGLEIRL